LSTISTESLNFSNALNRYYYIVPDYQREYVWKNDEVTQLLDDYSTQMLSSPDTEYFIGVVLVSARASENIDQVFELIDGQQRLTTNFLLINACMYLLENKNFEESAATLIRYTDFANFEPMPRLIPFYDNAESLFKKLIVGKISPKDLRDAMDAKGIGSFGSVGNLLDAYDTIVSYLRTNFETQEKLQDFFKYLIKKVVFIQIKTDMSSALKIFETINERGVGLNPMDLLKNLLFTKVKPADFSRLKDKWSEVTKPLEKENEKPLRFLRYFLMANYLVKHKVADSDIIREDEIYKWLTDSQTAEMIGYHKDPFGFIAKVSQGVKDYLNFRKGFGIDGHPMMAMQNLRELSGGSSVIHFILFLAGNRLPNHLFEYLVKQVETLQFYFVFTGTQTKYLERKISLWADEIRAIAEMEKGEAQNAQMSNFVMGTLQDEINGLQEQFKFNFTNFKQSQFPRYRTFYLLAKITQMVQAQFSGEQVVAPITAIQKLEIEHILPQDPEDDYRAQFIKQNPGEDYEHNVYSLGNLSLLEKVHNIVASNDFFERKLQIYRGSNVYLSKSIAAIETIGKNTSSNRINSKLKSYTSWNPETIKDRQLMLYNLAMEVWKLQPYS